MEKRLICIVLILCLLLTSCGRRTPEDPGSQEQPPVEMNGNEGGQKEEQPLPDVPGESGTQQPEEDEKEEPTDDEEPEEIPEEEPAPPPPPKYDPLVTVPAGEERVAGAASAGMSVGMEQVLLDLIDCYYQSVGGLSVQDCSERPPTD